MVSAGENVEILYYKFQLNRICDEMLCGGESETLRRTIFQAGILMETHMETIIRETGLTETGGLLSTAKVWGENLISSILTNGA